jgi:peroxiredoxin
MSRKQYNCQIAFTTVLFLLFQLTQAQKVKPEFFTVNCYVKGVTGSKIILQNKPASGTDDFFHVVNYDSCYPSSDSFQFRILVGEPEWRSISIEGWKGWRSFVAMPGKQIQIIGKYDSLYKSKIIGSKEDSLYKVMINTILFPLYKARDKSSPDSFRNIYPTIIRNAKYNFIKKNPSSFIVAKYLVEGDSYNRTKDTSEIRFLQKCYLALSSEAKKFTCSKNAYYNLFVANKKLLPGKTISNFSFMNYDNTKFDLESLIRKENKVYYLIDFWATWCGPCIAQFPKLKILYDKFKSDGFEIIGYSLDVDKNKLLDFIAKNNIKWKLVSDLKGEMSKVYKQFKLGTIPANFLIDRNGIIRGVNLSPVEVEKILDKKFPGKLKGSEVLK